MDTHIRSSVAALAAATALATAAAEPYAVIDGTDWPRTSLHAAPVTIASIDGKDYLDETRRLVAPGTRVIELYSTHVPKAKRNQRQQRRSITLEVKPCTAYYLYAQHPSKLASEFEVKVLREVPLKSCP